MIWPSHAHVHVQHQTKQSDSIASSPHLSILLVGVRCHWARLRVPCKARGVRKTCYGCKHLVLPCSTFTHGLIWLRSIGLTNESGHSVRSMSTTLFWAKQGTSTLIPVGNVYVDDVKGNRSCASIFVGQESDTIAFGLLFVIGLLPDTKGSCENSQARAVSAPWIWFASPPCTSHSKNRKGVLSPDGPDGKEIPQKTNAPSATDMQCNEGSRRWNKTTWISRIGYTDPSAPPQQASVYQSLSFDPDLARSPQYRRPKWPFSFHTRFGCNKIPEEKDPKGKRLTKMYLHGQNSTKMYLHGPCKSRNKCSVDFCTFFVRRMAILLLNIRQACYVVRCEG